MTAMPKTQQTKVWIYQSSTIFTSNQKNHIEQKLHDFVSNWSSHGDVVNGSFEIIEERFIIVFANEEEVMVSGCSIDSSVKIIKELEQELGLSLLDKSNIAFQQAIGEIKLYQLSQIPEAVNSGEINLESIVFNNAISNGLDFESSWKVKAKDTWVKRYFK